MEKTVYYHLPGLFEFCRFYKEFLPLYRMHRDYFYDWCEIASIYGAPADCIWGGGRVGFGDDNPDEVLDLLKEYDIQGRLTFSNSLLREEHLEDKKCNKLCRLFEANGKNGVIVHSELLSDYLKNSYPGLYQVSSTTKVITDFDGFRTELIRPEFSYVVPDFRLNKSLDLLGKLSQQEKDKVEFLVNECCHPACMDRKACYENVSRKCLGEDCEDHICKSLKGQKGYTFSGAMDNPMFISLEDIKNTYYPMGFSNYKLEGRGLGTALILEFLLYYMVKPEAQIRVREAIYLDSMLDLF